MIDLLNKNRRVLLVTDDKEKIKDLAGKVKSLCRHNLSSLAYYNLDGRYGLFTEDGEFIEKPVNCHSPSDGIVKVIGATDSNEEFIASPILYPTFVDTMLGFNGIRVNFIEKILLELNFVDVPELSIVLKGNLCLVGPRLSQIALVRGYKSIFR